MRLLVLALALAPTAALAHPEPAPAPPAPVPPPSDRWFTLAGIYDRSNDGLGVRVEFDLVAHDAWRIGIAASTAETSTDLMYGGNLTGYLTLQDHKGLVTLARHLELDGLLLRAAIGAGVVKTEAGGYVQPYAYGSPNDRDFARGEGVFPVLEGSFSIAKTVTPHWALTAGAVITRYAEQLQLTSVSIERADIEVMWMGGVKRRL